MTMNDIIESADRLTTLLEEQNACIERIMAIWTNKKPRQSLGIGLNYCFTKIPTSSPKEASFTNITGPDIIPSNIVNSSLNGINVTFDALYV